VFLLIFLEPSLDFPDKWYLQSLFFLLPVVGLGAIADSVVRLAYLIFSQKRNLPEWQRMMASLYSNHFVVVGMGKVGIRIVQGLVTLRESVVVIEREKESLFLDEVHALGVPVIAGDGRQRKTLEQASVAHAQAVILATDDDLANLDSALTAREINPQVRIVMRMFDDTLATKAGGAFNMPAISIAEVSAPAFIAAATGRKVYQDFQLAGQHVQLIDFTIHPQSRLVGQTVGEVQKSMDVNIVMHNGAQGVNVNPPHEVRLGGGDSLLVIAPLARLRALAEANKADHSEPRSR
jgi:Trk K+ transport system NAD-binding subunit